MVVDATARRGHMCNLLGGMLFGFGERVPRRDAPRAEDRAWKCLRDAVCCLREMLWPGTKVISATCAAS
jgi:hypothetical protein